MRTALPLTPAPNVSGKPMPLTRAGVRSQEACPPSALSQHEHLVTKPLTRYTQLAMRVCRPGTTSEDVDAKGVANIAEAWKAHRAQKGPERLQREELVSMRSPTDLGK